jgi:hypothetical protein
VVAANIVYSDERLKAEHARGYGPSHGYLSLGDIFFKRSEIEAKKLQTAWVVLTPACDLARPAAIETREGSIILCEGSVKALTPTTDLVGKEKLDQVIIQHSDGTPYAIDWRKKKVRIWDFEQYRELKADSAKFPWVHAGRMRPVYALQLQRVVFGDLERVGTMRRPVPYAPCGVEVLIPQADKWFVLPMQYDYVHDPSAGAISDDPNMQRKTFILSDVLLRETFETLSDWVAKNGGEPAAPILKTLSECDEALDRLMFHIVSTKEKKLAPGAVLDTNIYPLENAGLPEGVKAQLAKSVVFATYNRPQDEAFGSGKLRTVGAYAVLVFRFLKP